MQNNDCNKFISLQRKTSECRSIALVIVHNYSKVSNKNRYEWMKSQTKAINHIHDLIGKWYWTKSEKLRSYVISRVCMNTNWNIYRGREWLGNGVKISQAQQCMVAK